MVKDLKQKIIDSIKNLVTLEIVTAVGGITSVSKSDTTGGGGVKSLDIDLSKDAKVMLTKIDILQGDIKTVYDEEFVTGKYQNLKAFHTEREKEGYNIIKQNIEILKKLLKLITDQSEA